MQHAKELERRRKGLEAVQELLGEGARYPTRRRSRENSLTRTRTLSCRASLMRLRTCRLGVEEVVDQARHRASHHERYSVVSDRHLQIDRLALLQSLEAIDQTQMLDSLREQRAHALLGRHEPRGAGLDAERRWRDAKVRRHLDHHVAGRHVRGGEQLLHAALVRHGHLRERFGVTARESVEVERRRVERVATYCRAQRCSMPTRCCAAPLSRGRISDQDYITAAGEMHMSHSLAVTCSLVRAHHTWARTCRQRRLDPGESLDCIPTSRWYQWLPRIRIAFDQQRVGTFIGTASRFTRSRTHPRSHVMQATREAIKVELGDALRRGSILSVSVAKLPL